MDHLHFTFTAKLWLYSGKGAWHFVTLPVEVAHGIRFLHGTSRGFTPLPVTAQIGDTIWKTSVFPDSKSGSFLLAVKKDVRKAERLQNGTEATVTLRLTDV